jgi:site-specific DNA recombinase
VVGVTTPMTTTTTLAREYVRVSKDDSGRARSLTEQLDDNRARWAGELALNGTAYADASIPASRYSTKVRGGYDALSADLAAGRFGADVLVLWEASRGSRRVGEWADLIDLCEAAGVRIAVTTHGRIYDPANGRDRRSLLEDAVDAEYESPKISDRTRRAMSRNGVEGRPHGRVPFGYRRRYDPVTRQLVAQDPDPDTAPIVRELFDRLERGHSLKAIARDFEARGVTNLSGRPFSAQHLRVLARNEVYDGKREHRGTLTDATWPALVDHATFLAVQHRLSDPARRTSRDGRAKHLLSGIARCDDCGGGLAVEWRGGRPVYRCHTTVAMADLDAYATAAILGYLTRPDNVERLTAPAGDDRLEAARIEIAEIRAELDDLADQVGRGALSATLAARAEPRLLERLRQAEAREAELATPSALRGILGPADDVERRWEAAPISARREVARLVLSPELLGELSVVRAPSRGADVVDRVTWRHD